MNESIKEIFYRRVNKTDSCWIWMGYKYSNGYGQVTIKGVKGLTHRLYWMFENGPIPTGMYICHKCDNPSCVNPDHLFLGTQLDNVRDMIKKGRQNFGHPCGEENHFSKLTEDQVMLIRTSKLRPIQLAKKYAISPTNICDI